MSCRLKSRHWVGGGAVARLATCPMLPRLAAKVSTDDGEYSSKKAGREGN
jgi:hypothetical protein